MHNKRDKFFTSSYIFEISEQFQKLFSELTDGHKYHMIQYLEKTYHIIIKFNTVIGKSESLETSTTPTPGLKISYIFTFTITLSPEW